MTIIGKTGSVIGTKVQYSLMFFCLITTDNALQTGRSKSAIEDIVEIKAFKKLLRSKTNILVCFINYPSTKTTQALRSFRDAADILKGHGTMVIVDCSGTTKKMCRKLKVNEDDPVYLKHYKNGEFHKDYDRKTTTSSLINFMRDPSGGIPWEEDPSATDVVHLPDPDSLVRFLKKGPVLNRPSIIMFFAPWCGHCKTLKPEYSNAATDLKGEAFLAAVDVSRPENSGLIHQYNISVFPTLLFYENGKLKFPYEGENNRAAIVEFMRDPQPMQKNSIKSHIPKEKDWALTISDVIHLTSDTFDPMLKEEKSALVVFHAPWCGHCKRIKPEYERAASLLKDRGISGMLAAVDATKEPELASKFGVKGYPTLKYFANGEFKYDISLREEMKIVEFMKELETLRATGNYLWTPQTSGITKAPGREIDFTRTESLDPQEPTPPPPPQPMWPENEASNIVHLQATDFRSTLKKKKHALVMFYAPWCSHCKRAKPEFLKLADALQEDSRTIIGAVDCTEHQSLCQEQGIKGYPTIKYFSYFDKVRKDYTGNRVAADMIEFMKDPTESTPSVSKVKVDVSRSQYEIDVLDITDKTFEKEIKSPGLTLVMFHAPWCGYCTKTKPAFEAAAKQIEKEKLKAKLRMMDATLNPKTAKDHDISAFPTFKLFGKSLTAITYSGERTTDGFLTYIKNNLNVKEEL